MQEDNALLCIRNKNSFYQYLHSYRIYVEKYKEVPESPSSVYMKAIVKRAYNPKVKSHLKNVSEMGGSK